DVNHLVRHHSDTLERRAVGNYRSSFFWRTVNKKRSRFVNTKRLLFSNFYTIKLSLLAPQELRTHKIYCLLFYGKLQYHQPKHAMYGLSPYLHFYPGYVLYRADEL